MVPVVVIYSNLRRIIYITGITSVAKIPHDITRDRMSKSRDHMRSSRDHMWAVGQNYFISWHLSGEHLGHGFFERKIDILLSKNAPKQQNCHISRKRVTFD